jgi:tripartite-type tricarboxylate transporter receptor subunit TctC
MTNRNRLTWIKRAGAALASVCAIGAVSPLQAQSADTLRIVVPYPPGGGSDRAARLVAESLRKKLGTPVVVENITGAGGRVAMQQIRNMPANTNVVVLANPALMVVAPLVLTNIGYDPDTDFQPVSEIVAFEMALAVASAVPVREFNHLTAWIRANPEKANLGVPATGSLPHFFALMVGQKAKAKVEVVGYRGSAPLVTDLLGGHLPAGIDSFDSFEPLHTGGKIRILATSGAKRLLPDVPTFKEAGLDLVAQGWNTLFAKSTMPADKVAAIATAVSQVMLEPGIREQIVAQKTIPISANLQQTRASIKTFKDQWVPVVKAAGLKLD